jgi:hypothetical protein
VRLEPLYRITFRYAEAWQTSADFLGIAQGRVEGRLAGRFRGANRARRLADGTFLPDLSGAIATADGATVLVRLTGYGRPDAEPTGRVVASVTHACEDDRYAWLDGVLGVVAGEVRGGREIVLDVAELVWEPLDGTITP